jgi:hypothetical protein
VALPADDRSEHFEVLPENWEAVQLFLRCQTQWRTGMAGLIGLDYAAVHWLFRLYEVEDHRSVLEDLQTMEAAVLMVISKRAK